MIPNADQLEVIAQMSRGDLAETPYPVLLHALAVHRRTVVLEIERQQLKKQIIFEAGMPVDCHSNLLHETLGRFMVARGDITEEQCQLIRSKAVTAGQAFAEALVSEGNVSSSDLYKILQQNLAKKLLDGFTWQSGDFSVFADMPAVESPLRVKTPQLIVTGITKLVPDEEIARAIEPIVDKRLVVNPSPPYSQGELRLTEEHQLMMELLSQGEFVGDLVRGTNKPPEKVLRLLYALAVVGLVVPEGWLHREPVVASPDKDFMLPMPELLQTSQSEAGTTPSEEIRQQITDLHLRYRRQDPFELLGLTERASPEEIERRYLEFSERFAPWKFAQRGAENMLEKARELFMAGSHAYAVLSDPEKRKSLLARRQDLLATQTLRFSRDQVPIHTALLDSETQFKKGKELMDAEIYEEALGQLRFAHELDPQNPIYRAELAYCRYVNQPETAAHEALQELNDALRIDPHCGLAAYYAGIIHSEMANLIEAEAYLQKAVKLMEEDPRPVEALKGLREAREKP